MAYLGNPKETIAVLQKYGFNFQKKFGQNFLIDTHVLNKIVDAAGVTKDDMVLEIGPGIGTLTQYLCESARKVIAVEIDRNLISILQDTLSEYDNVTVINEDVLKVDLVKLAEEENRLVFLVDDDILENEFPALMGAKLKETVPELSSQAEYRFTGFSYCKEEFLELFRQLQKTV